MPTRMLAEGTFDGQVAVVTGGGSGMGRAMALEFSRLGAAVVVAGRRAEPLAETAAMIEGAGGTALAEPTDVRDPEQVDSLMHAAVDTFGRIDCLVNNAAGNFVVKAEELSPNGWKAVTSIVLDGGFLCSRAGGLHRRPRRAVAHAEPRHRARRRRAGNAGDARPGRRGIRRDALHDPGCAP